MLERTRSGGGMVGVGWSPVQVAPQLPRLNPKERAQAEQVARRLHAELRNMVAILPEPSRGASAMARLLSMDRATCQRIVGVASRPQVGVESLVQLPGIQGLRQFVAAVGARKEAKGHAEELAAAAAAVERFEALIDQLGGSQRRLRARLEIEDAALPAPAITGGPEDPATREALFQAAAAVTGRWSSMIMDARIVRPVPGQPHLTEGLRARAMIGHVSRADAVPLEVGGDAPLQTPHPGTPAFATLDAAAGAGRPPASLLAEFSTQPLPTMVSRSAGDKVFSVLDTAAATVERPVDIVLASRGASPDRHPATRRPAVGEMWFLVTFPARRLVYDVYLHRDIARRCIPSLELHLWGPDVSQGHASRWSTRFPGGPRLEVLGPGLARTQTAAYSRHAELMARIFETVGWPADEFIGYRCEVAYPIWRAGYCMAFDFTGNEELAAE